MQKSMKRRRKILKNRNISVFQPCTVTVQGFYYNRYLQIYGNLQQENVKIREKAMHFACEGWQKVVKYSVSILIAREGETE